MLIMDRRGFIKGAAGALATLGTGVAYYPGLANAGLAPKSKRELLLQTAPGFKNPELASDSEAQVGMALALVFDSSDTIKPDEMRAQFRAAARALQDKDFKDRIFDPGGGPGSLALCVVDFSDRVNLRIPWFDIRNREEADEKLSVVYNKLVGMPRSQSDATFIANMLQDMNVVMHECPWKSEKRTMDVFGDGKDTYDHKYSVADQRDHFISDTATQINALAILNEVPDLDDYFKDELVQHEAVVADNGHIVNPGFCIAAAGRPDGADGDNALKLYEYDIHNAFKRKLLTELAGRSIPHQPSFA